MPRKAFGRVLKQTAVAAQRDGLSFYSKERNICILADCANSVLRDNPDTGMYQERNRDIHNASES